MKEFLPKHQHGDDKMAVCSPYWLMMLAIEPQSGPAGCVSSQEGVLESSP